MQNQYDPTDIRLTPFERFGCVVFFLLFLFCLGGWLAAGLYRKDNDRLEALLRLREARMVELESGLNGAAAEIHEIRTAIREGRAVGEAF
jgi:hypothetical protein